MFIIVSFQSELHFLYKIVSSTLYKKPSAKKTAENKCNLALSSAMKTNIMENVKKRILVISNSDTCPRC